MHDTVLWLASLHQLNDHAIIAWFTSTRQSDDHAENGGEQAEEEEHPFLPDPPNSLEEAIMMVKRGRSMLLRAFEIQGRSEEEMNLLRTLCNTIILRMIIIQKVWDLIKLTDLEKWEEGIRMCFIAIP